MLNPEKCAFCKKEDIEKEGSIIDQKEGRLWYALVPIEPEIFGHLIVTYSDKGVHCIRNIWEDHGEFAAIEKGPPWET